jgi:molybdopterin synthase catalytic subunit
MVYSESFAHEGDPPEIYKNKRITFDEIDEEYILKSFNNDYNSGEFGATVSFVGTVRGYSKNGKVKGMDYEGYLGMAEIKIKEIETIVKEKWDIKKIRIIHRLGKLSVGEKSIIILVSTSHSKAAFEACQFILERIKNEVPIWKKEIFSNGTSKWIDGNLII